MQGSYLVQLVQARFLIGFLGEKPNFGWWPTTFFEPTSRLFLEPVFTKTYRLSQYHGVVEAARLLHDEHLSVGSYHLFRLPEEVEQDLHAAIQGGLVDQFANQAILSTKAALEELEQLAASDSTFGVGPIAVGSIKSIDSVDTLKAMAAAYLSAFTRNVKSYPYLVG